MNTFLFFARVPRVRTCLCGTGRAVRGETGSVLSVHGCGKCVRCDAMGRALPCCVVCGCWLKPEEESCETRSVFGRRGPGGKSEMGDGSTSQRLDPSLLARRALGCLGVIFPMVASVLWAGVGRGRGSRPAARACGEGGHGTIGPIALSNSRSIFLDPSTGWKRRRKTGTDTEGRGIVNT